ncbi:Uncharacterized protein HZ326_4121 [Fusarium oxysporum f. sp. albedinis]|nr:Uncharacterized protein HZ326_4121 [Fusarium oxysporum f. sp. albedinis]
MLTETLSMALSATILPSTVSISANAGAPLLCLAPACPAAAKPLKTEVHWHVWKGSTQVRYVPSYLIRLDH